MTQDPSIPPDENRLPPRHRVSLEQLRKDGVESDLWELDENRPVQAGDPVFDEPLEIETTAPVLEPELTAVAEDAGETGPGVESPATPIEMPENPREHRHPSRRDEMGELGDWDDADVPLPDSPHTGVTAPDPLEAHREPEAPSSVTSPAAPRPNPGAPHRKSFSRNEIIAMGSVLLTLMLLAGFYMISALGGLPRAVDPYQKPALPAKGDHFEVSEVRTYWRVPVTTGPDADTVQRGTELMPMVELVASGENAALRVQFRNSEGMAVGDPITRNVRGSTTLTIPSTAGLEDINTHNAYRTGLIEPWTVEILEASAGTTSGESFRSLITVPISPDRE